MINTFHLVHNIDDSYGGPAKSIPYLMSSLEKLGNNQEVISLKYSNNETNEVISKLNLKSTSFQTHFLKAAAYSPNIEDYLVKRIRETNNQIIHYHNIWNYIPLIANKVAVNTNVPIVASPRGNLFPWNLKKGYLKKKLYMEVFQRRYFNTSDCIHVTSKEELRAVKNLGLNAPIGLISNGVDIDEFKNMQSKEKHRDNLGIDVNKKYILYMGRIEQKKGLLLLLHTYKDFVKKNDEWKILIAGPAYDKKYFQDCKDFAINAGLDKHIEWLGMVSGSKRIDAYGAADLFVLPTHSENFGIVIAEALASGLPVITTNGTPWAEIQNEFAGYIIPLEKRFLLSSIDNFSKLSILEKNEMAANAKNIAKRYSWDKPGHEMAQLYEWILGKRNQPKFIF